MGGRELSRPASADVATAEETAALGDSPESEGEEARGNRASSVKASGVEEAQLAVKCLPVGESTGCSTLTKAPRHREQRSKWAFVAISDVSTATEARSIMLKCIQVKMNPGPSPNQLWAFLVQEKLLICGWVLVQVHVQVSCVCAGMVPAIWTSTFREV